MVGRVRCEASSIAHLCRKHTSDPPETPFCSPKAAHAWTTTFDFQQRQHFLSAFSCFDIKLQNHHEIQFVNYFAYFFCFLMLKLQNLISCPLFAFCFCDQAQKNSYSNLHLRAYISVIGFQIYWLLVGPDRICGFLHFCAEFLGKKLRISYEWFWEYRS